MKYSWKKLRFWGKWLHANKHTYARTYAHTGANVPHQKKKKKKTGNAISFIVIDHSSRNSVKLASQAKELGRERERKSLTAGIHCLAGRLSLEQCWITKGYTDLSWDCELKTKCPRLWGGRCRSLVTHILSETCFLAQSLEIFFPQNEDSERKNSVVKCITKTRNVLQNRNCLIKICFKKNALIWLWKCFIGLSQPSTRNFLWGCLFEVSRKLEEGWAAKVGNL